MKRKTLIGLEAIAAVTVVGCIIGEVANLFGPQDAGIVLYGIVVGTISTLAGSGIRIYREREYKI
jgi:hypothetical protein